MKKLVIELGKALKLRSLNPAEKAIVRPIFEILRNLEALHLTTLSSEQEAVIVSRVNLFINVLEGLDEPHTTSMLTLALYEL